MVAIFVSVGNDEGDDVDRFRNVCVVIFCELGNLVFFYVLLFIR